MKSTDLFNLALVKMAATAALEEEEQERRFPTGKAVGTAGLLAALGLGGAYAGRNQLAELSPHYGGAMRDGMNYAVDKGADGARALQSLLASLLPHKPHESTGVLKSDGVSARATSRQLLSPGHTLRNAYTDYLND